MSLRSLAVDEFRRAEALELASLNQEAEVAYRNAIAMDNSLVEAHVNLGNLLFARYRFEEAIAAYARALQFQPSFVEVCLNLGLAQYGAGRLQDACASYGRALAAPSIRHAVHHNLGRALRAQGRFADAVASYEAAISCQPDMVEAQAALAETKRMMGKPGEAFAQYRDLSIRFPADPQWYFAMANCQVDLNEINAALANFRRVIELDADNAQAHSALIFCGQYQDIPCADSVRIARDFGRLVSRRATRHRDWRCDPAPSRLRVGFVSGDLHAHPVSYFLESVVSNLDANRVHLTAYSNHPLTDSVTERLAQHFDQWRPIHDLPDAVAAERIRDDGVHVLIDLAGHTAGNRLPLFAHKPARVQATWLGYPGTTGVNEIDYFMADPASVDEDTQQEYTERLWLLPDTRLCFTPPTLDLLPDRLPAADSAGAVRYGCFSNSVKINAAVLGSWAEILRRDPESSLLLKSATYYASDGATLQMRQRLEAAGLPMTRVAIEPPEPRDAYLRAYQRVDIMLDTFPYTGATTTVEALWMGVPVVTLRGRTIVARQGAAILGACALDDWVARDVPGYVETALTKARTVQELRRSRHAFRAALASSAICDAARFAAAFEAAVWSMWRQRHAANLAMPVAGSAELP